MMVIILKIKRIPAQGKKIFVSVLFLSDLMQNSMNFRKVRGDSLSLPACGWGERINHTFLVSQQVYLFIERLYFAA